MAAAEPSSSAANAGTEAQSGCPNAMKCRPALRACVLSGLLALPLLFTAGCPESPKKPASSPAVVYAPVAAGAYADGPAGLQKFFTDLLAAARKEQPEKVISMLGSLALSQDELGELLGSAAAAQYFPRYQAMMSELTHLGGLELVDQIQKRHFDEVLVVPVREQPAAEQTATERKVARALPQTVPLYSVRLKRSTEPRGIRYEFFVYLNGRWRTGNLLGQLLPAEPAADAAPAAPAAP